jgi:hypothetical protein
MADNYVQGTRYFLRSRHSTFPPMLFNTKVHNGHPNSITSLYPETVQSIPTTYLFKQLHFTIIYGHIWASSVCLSPWDFPTQVLCALLVTFATIYESPISTSFFQTCCHDCWRNAMSQRVMQNQLAVDQAGRQEDCLGSTVAVKMWESVKPLLFSNRFSATPRHEMHCSN